MPVAERQWGQDVLNEELKSDRLNPDKAILGTEVGIAGIQQTATEPVSLHLSSCPAGAEDMCVCRCYEVHRCAAFFRRGLKL